MNCKLAFIALASLMGAPGFASGAPVSNDKITVVAAPGSYIYVMPKSGARSVLQQQRLAAQRAEAARRQAAAQAQLTNPIPEAPVPAVAPALTYPVAPPNFQTPAQSYLVRPATINPGPIQAAPVKQAPKKMAPTEPAEPKSRPIWEASGPEYNDRDSLLGYQQEQAEKGNPESEYALGMRYLTGNGVPTNLDLGRDWLERSSAHGNLRAREKLRQLRAAAAREAEQR
jgi:TPR repeat protein